MSEGIVGLDIGTSSCKVVIFNSAGEELSRASSETYQNNSPQPGWVEQDPDVVWRAVVGVIKESVSRLPADCQVMAVCMAAQSGSVIPVDKNGDPVYPLITWLDGRSEEIVEDWKKSGIEDQVKSLSGWSLYSGLPLPTIAWLKKNLPDVFLSTRHFFSINDLIAFRLTGERITNPSNAGGMQLVDIRTGAWSEDLCDLAGITSAQLSSIQPSAARIGEIPDDICREVGLRSGAVLYNGGHDQGCTALGLGITDPGKLLLAGGTAWVFTSVSTDPGQTGIPESLDLNFHVVPERWTISQSLGGLGASLEWWLKQAWTGSRTERFSSLDQLLLEKKLNPDLFFIPLTGGHDDPSTTRSGGFIGLGLHHGREDLARAIMEGAGYELLWAVEPLRNKGLDITELWLVGGASASPVWSQILADITECSIQIPAYDQWPAAGAAMLAGKSLGVIDEQGQGWKNLRDDSLIIPADQARSGEYQRSFEAYRKIVNHVRVEI